MSSSVDRRVTLEVPGHSTLALLAQTTPGVIGHLAVIGDAMLQARGIGPFEAIRDFLDEKSKSEDDLVSLSARMKFFKLTAPFSSPVLHDRSYSNERASYVGACLMETCRVAGEGRILQLMSDSLESNEDAAARKERGRSKRPSAPRSTKREGWSLPEIPVSSDDETAESAFSDLMDDRSVSSAPIKQKEAKPTSTEEGRDRPGKKVFLNAFASEKEEVDDFPPHPDGDSESKEGRGSTQNRNYLKNLGFD